MLTLSLTFNVRAPLRIRTRFIKTLVIILTRALVFRVTSLTITSVGAGGVATLSVTTGHFSTLVYILTCLVVKCVPGVTLARVVRSFFYTCSCQEQTVKLKISKNKIYS